MAPGYRDRRRTIQEAESLSQSQTQSQHRNGRTRRASDASEQDAEDPTSTGSNKYNVPEIDVQLMVKNFVRLALACENIRATIKREDFSKKVVVNDHRRCFPLIFERTQERLRGTFGMEMVEMPVRDRTRNMTMTQQRKAAHNQASTAQTQTVTKPTKSWILRNILPPSLKQISQRQHMESDRNYNAIISVVLILVVMSDEQCCSEGKTISAFERLKWHPTTPVGPFEEVISRMSKQGYIDRVKDDQSNDGAYNLYLGPRGKLETLQNQEEMFSVISKIYRHDGDDDDAREKLKRVIQDTLEVDEDVGDDEEDASEADEAVETQLSVIRENGHNRTRKKQRRQDA